VESWHGRTPTGASGQLDGGVSCLGVRLLFRRWLRWLPGAGPVAVQTPAGTGERSAAWALLVGSGAALAVGIVANVAREESAQQYNSQAAAYNAQDQAQLYGSKSSLAPPSPPSLGVLTGLSVAGYAIGAALGVTATVFLLRPTVLARSHEGAPTRESSRSGVRCGLGPLAFGCVGEF